MRFYQLPCGATTAICTLRIEYPAPWVARMLYLYRPLQPITMRRYIAFTRRCDGMFFAKEPSGAAETFHLRPAIWPAARQQAPTGIVSPKPCRELNFVEKISALLGQVNSSIDKVHRPRHGIPEQATAPGPRIGISEFKTQAEPVSCSGSMTNRWVPR